MLMASAVGKIRADPRPRFEPHFKRRTIRRQPIPLRDVSDRRQKISIWGMTVLRSTPNNSKRWSDEDLARLRELAASHKSAQAIALRLRRTKAAVRAKAVQEGLRLKAERSAPVRTN